MAKILVVDDNKDLRETTQVFLEESALEVVPAIDGRGAKEILESRHEEIGVVLTDYQMPRMNGVDLIKLVKVCYPWIKTILMSADDPQFVEQLAKSAGADYFVVKPFNITELAGKIKEFLEKEEAEMAWP